MRPDPWRMEEAARSTLLLLPSSTPPQQRSTLRHCRCREAVREGEVVCAASWEEDEACGCGLAARGRGTARGANGGEGERKGVRVRRWEDWERRSVGLRGGEPRPRWLLGRTWGEQSTTLKLEDGFAADVYAGLAAAGHDVERVGGPTATMGHAGAIVRSGDGLLEGATDPRSDGQVAAW